MPPLDSPDWARLRHAYGVATDLPPMLNKLWTDDWELVWDELVNEILHQGDVYQAAYAAASHLVACAEDIGPGEQSDAMLYQVGRIARGGPEVPDWIEEDWEDAQEEARQLILDRLIAGQVSETYAVLLLSALLNLSGQWSLGETLDRWRLQDGITFLCPQCETTGEVSWHDGGPNVDLSPSELTPIVPDEGLEFEDEQLVEQILGLAELSGHASTERQVRMLFGTVKCCGCGMSVPMVAS